MNDSEKTFEFPKPGLQPGTLLKERYRIEKELGAGGIGMVFLAKDTQLYDRPVVVKVLHEKSEDSSWLQKKFRQEIEALVRIKHTGVVGVFDAGQTPDAKLFVVMEFVEGMDLRSVLKGLGAGMGLERAANIIRQIGPALTAAHDEGIFHCDLKPENIMLLTSKQGDELVKLIDFGVAKVKDSLVASLTETRIAGTFLYMAPEQLMGVPSALSDIYALGVIVYEMLTQKGPFPARTVAHLYELQRAGVQVNPGQLRPDLPQAAEEAILRTLSFDPDVRYHRARDFTDDLSKALVSNLQTDKLAAQKSAPLTETAYVLSIDIVGYSILPSNEKKRVLKQLQEVIAGTTEYGRAVSNHQLIPILREDGIALEFFEDSPTAALCAIETAQALKQSSMEVRMGIDKGPVFRNGDLETNRNVAGGGLSGSERVMDCGDSGHILLTKPVAETLRQLADWVSSVHDLGEAQIRAGNPIQLFNLHNREIGNPRRPAKLGTALTIEKRKFHPALIIIPFLIAILIGGYAIWKNLQPSAPPTVVDIPTPAPVKERAINYYVEMQKYRDGKEFEQPIKLAGEVIFEKDYRVRLFFSSPETGYLYLLNEGPIQRYGGPSYNVLFPTTSTNNGSAQLAANQVIQVPSGWFKFDSEAGTEKLWMIWAEQAVPDLETIKSVANPTEKGVVSNIEHLNALKNFFVQHSVHKPTVEEKRRKYSC